MLGNYEMKTIEAITKELRGQVCWGVNWAPNLNLSMSFGEPHLRIREPHVTKSKAQIVQQWASCRMVTVKGRWWLWICSAYWKLTFSDSLVATSSASLRQKTMAMARLHGQKLKDIRVTPETGATEFLFDLGGSLQVRRFNLGASLRVRKVLLKKDSYIWTLSNYKNGFSLGVRRDGTFTYCRGSTPFDKMKPRRISAS